MKARVSFSLCLSPSSPSLPCLLWAGHLGSLPSPSPSPALGAGRDEGRCWDGRLSERRRRGERGERGGRGGGSANYTEQLWGLLKSRMKQRAAEASAAVGAEEPEHHREPEPVVLPAGSDRGHPEDPAALCPLGDILRHSHRAPCQLWARREEGAGSPGGAGLSSAIRRAGLEGSGVSPTMVPGR